MNIQVKKTSALQTQPVFNDGVKDVFTGLPGTTVTTDSTLSFHPTLDPSPQIRGGSRGRERELAFKLVKMVDDKELLFSEHSSDIIKGTAMKQASCHPDIGLT